MRVALALRRPGSARHLVVLSETARPLANLVRSATATMSTGETLVALTCSRCGRDFSREKRNVKYARHFCSLACAATGPRVVTACGEYRTYRNGCRCALCRSANAARCNALRERRLASASNSTEPQSKVCGGCQRRRALADFDGDEGSFDGLRRNCKRCLRYSRNWRRANPVTVSALTEARRVRLLSSLRDAPVSPEGVAARFAVFGNRCAYCKATERLTIDHVIPISRGGRHILANIRPSCRSCNSSKCGQPLTQWLARRQMHP
jgi:5-methylcytosine-specific restriction endonuclease McrA